MADKFLEELQELRRKLSKKKAPKAKVVVQEKIVYKAPPAARKPKAAKAAPPKAAPKKRRKSNKPPPMAPATQRALEAMFANAYGVNQPQAAQPRPALGTYAPAPALGRPRK